MSTVDTVDAEQTANLSELGEETRFVIEEKRETDEPVHTGFCSDGCPGGHKRPLLVSLDDTTELLLAPTYEGFLRYAAGLLGGGVECFRSPDPITEEMWADWGVGNRVHEVAGVLNMAEIYADPQVLRDLRNSTDDLASRDKKAFGRVVFRNEDVAEAMDKAAGLLEEAEKRILDTEVPLNAERRVDVLVALSDRWVHLARLRSAT